MKTLRHALLICALGACAARSSARGRPVGTDPGEVTRGSLARRARRASARPAFWSAIAAVDCDAADRGADSVDERIFATGFRALVESRVDQAFVAFHSLLASDDTAIRKAARTGLTLSLEGQGRWRDLAAELRTGAAADARDRASIQLWARAFGTLGPAEIRVPVARERLTIAESGTGTPIVSVKVNGSPRHFWLDTGASMTRLAADVARELGVEPIGRDTLAVATLAGRVPALPAVIDHLELGSVEVRGLPVAVLDPSAMRFDHRRERVDGQMVDVRVKLDGVIGTDFMRFAEVRLDLTNGVFAVKPTHRCRRIGADASAPTRHGAEAPSMGTPSRRASRSMPKATSSR